MVRWDPDAAGRLREAAMALFAEHGFESTTVAQIAHRAGVTGRTFFRHFADKQEVLFAESEELENAMVDGLSAVQPDASLIQTVGAGLEAAALSLADRRDFAARRHVLIVASPVLQERQLIKMASLVAALTIALVERGLDPPVATLAAEVGITVFRVGFERWIDGPPDADLSVLMRATLAELAELAV